MIPELTGADWIAYCRDPLAFACVVTGCGRVSPTRINVAGESVVWSGCGHRAFWPEEGPTAWPEGIQRG